MRLVTFERRWKWGSGIASVLIAGVVFAGCFDERSPSPATHAGALEEKSGGPAPLEGVRQPEILALHATLLEAPTTEGNALVTAQVADNDPVTDQFTVFTDETNPDRPVVFRDDGQNGDEVAGDRVFSVIENFNFDELSEINAHIDEIEQQGQRAVTAIFDERMKLGERPAQRFDPSVIKPGVPIPIEAVGISPAESDASNPSAAAIIPSRSLIITHPSVVNDPARTFNRCTGVGTPMGRWTFGYMMHQMANPALTGINPSNFVMTWLNHWTANQNLNTWNVQHRGPTMNNLIINPWLAASGGGQLNLARAPFRLVAIVNRVDLRSNPGYGGGNSGETRFVFALEDSNCNVRSPGFLVILEYGNIQRTCQDVRNWGKRWASLSTLPFPSANYNAALEILTETVVKANAAPAKPNRSAINQVRTNEFALSAPLGLPWEMREFRLLTPTPAMLREDTVKRTPDLSLNNTAVFANCVNANTPGILTGAIDPLQCPPPQAFRGGSSPVPAVNQVCWRGPGIPPANRFTYSLNTCSGCHGVETGTAFTHINEFGGLSGFLTGIIGVPDCNGAPVARNYNDLQRRRQDLFMLVNSQCIRQISMRSLPAIH